MGGGDFYVKRQYGNLSVQLYDNPKHQIAKPRNPNRPGGITARMPPHH